MFKNPRQFGDLKCCDRDQEAADVHRLASRRHSFTAQIWVQIRHDRPCKWRPLATLGGTQESETSRKPKHEGLRQWFEWAESPVGTGDQNPITNQINDIAPIGARLVHRCESFHRRKLLVADGRFRSSPASQFIEQRTFPCFD